MNSPDLQAAIKSLSKADWKRFYVAYGVEVLMMLAVLLVAVQTSIYWAPVWICLLGILQHRWAILGHDASHVRFTKNAMVNRLTAESIGFPLFIPVYGGYQKSHFEHHSHLGSEADPEHAYREGWGYGISWRKVITTFAGDLIGLGMRSQYRFTRDVFPDSWVARASLLCFWLIVLVAVFCWGLQYALVLWCLALVTSFWAVFRVRAYFEHVDVPLAGKHTSHRFDAGWIARFAFFPHNTWCHYEHHLYPSVPFYNLPKLRAILRQPKFKPVTQAIQVPSRIGTQDLATE